MTPDELLQFVAAQPTVSVEREISIPGPQLKALLAEGKPVLLATRIAHPDQHRERRMFRYAHMLDSGLTLDAIESWQSNHPQHLLPPDLVAFLARVNGVHMWADLASSHAYFGILPLNNWQDAKDTAWAMMFDTPPTGQLVMSYHDNGDNYLLLDTHGPEYLWYDLEDFNRPKRVGSTVAELVEFWLQETAWLDPRRSGGVIQPQAD
ncbi:MAG TPA: SMI1/KNR4 family protein [Tepidisphaeraceae bacterium]|nr:SMI1/KNR4 family protein [Tepidisphaeraceae bacterium]